VFTSLSSSLNPSFPGHKFFRMSEPHNLSEKEDKKDASFNYDNYDTDSEHAAFTELIAEGELPSSTFPFRQLTSCVLRPQP
jgi:hypothetical protein